MPVTVAVCGAVFQRCAYRADIDIFVMPVAEVFLVINIAALVRSAVTRHQGDTHLPRQMTYRRGEVPCIHTCGHGLQPEPFCLPLQTCDIRLAVVNISRRRPRICNDAVFAVHRAVVQVKEPLRLVVPVHEATFRVGGTDFGVLNDDVF